MNTDLGRVQPLLTQAQQEEAPQAINTLAAAQHPLLTDLNNKWLSSADRQRATTSLQQVLGPAIRQTLEAYNTQALVKPLKTLQTHSFSVSCSAASGRLGQLVAVQGSSSGSEQPMLFAHVAAQSASPVYLLNVNASGTSVSCGALIDSSVVDLTTDGSQLYLLHEESGSRFSIEDMAPTADAKPQQLLVLPTDSSGALPALLAVHGTQEYVIYRGTNNDTVYACSSSTPAGSCKPLSTSPLPVQAHSMAIAPNGLLYLLLVDGSIGVLTPTGTLHPADFGALLPALPISDPSSFNPLTPLPTVPAQPMFSATPTATPANGTPTATPGTNQPYTPTGVKLTNATVLVSDQQNRLFIGDGTDHRIVRLDAPATGTSDPIPSQQYVDASALDSLQSVSVVDHGAQGFSLYELGDHSLLVMTLQ